jgi:hypothetical protein
VQHKCNQRAAQALGNAQASRLLQMQLHAYCPLLPL